MTAPGATGVRHYLAGGLEDSGGIGRLVGHIVAGEGVGHHRVTDTRGPRWAPLPSALRLAASLGAMARDRIVAPGRIHHVHVAGRGSTVRKVILCAAARTLGCTHVLHLHDFAYAEDFVRRPGWQQALVRGMFRRADRVIVLGRRDRDTAETLLGVAPARITVLPNAVPDPGPRTMRAAGVPRIVFLGALGARKGVPDLLAALASPAMAGSGWQAVLAGGGAVAAYRAEVDRLGLADRVTLPGWVGEAEARRLTAAADILVLPSHQEGMAMAVLEGLAHGLAIVTTPVGAHPEAVTDGVNGVFVPPGDVPALTAALARLVGDRAGRERLGAAARARYLERFAMADYLGALAAVHARLASPAVPVAARTERRPT